MLKVLMFKVEIKKLENKIWRIIEITDLKTVADLVYTILATFDSLAYHLYDVRYKNFIYDSMIEVDYHENNKLTDATITKLCKLNLRVNDKLVMNYDFGTTTTFLITYLGERELEKGKGQSYPHIIDGQGHGMLDDVSLDELIYIVKDTDKRGKSVYDYSSGYQRRFKYDYRNYDIEKDNHSLKEKVNLIKQGYE